MHENDVNTGNECVFLPSFYGIASLTKFEHVGRHVTPHDSIKEQAKDICGVQLSSTEDLLDLAYHHDNNGFSVRLSPIRDTMQILVLTWS